MCSSDLLADVIAGALQGVDGQGPKPRTRPEAKREPLDTVDQDLDQDQDQDVDTIQQDMLERDATRQGTIHPYVSVYKLTRGFI